MFIKIKTYRDEEPYLTLNRAREIFYKALKDLDFKKKAEECGFSDTAQALVMLALRIGGICESIVSIENYYSSAILYRSVIEHVVKHVYISLYSRTNDDIAGKYVSAEHVANEIRLKMKKVKWPAHLKLKKDFEDSIKKVAKQFSLDQMLRCMVDKVDGDDDLVKAFRSALIDYSVLSSYVHGGPTAVLNPQDHDIKVIKKISVNLTIISYFYTMTRFSLFNSDCQQMLKAVINELEEILGTIDKEWYLYET